MELKPCPFCGGEPEYTEIGNLFVGISETRIKCKECRTVQIHKWRKLKLNFAKIEELTVTAWNRRKELE